VLAPLGAITGCGASILHLYAAGSTREKGESAESRAGQRPGRRLGRRYYPAQSEVSDLGTRASERAAIGIIERLRRSPRRCAAGNREWSIRENPILCVVEKRPGVSGPGASVCVARPHDGVPQYRAVLRQNTP